jgi:hypothetical protein
MSRLFLLFLLFLSVPIFACKCETLSLEKSFKNADIVFIGNIYSVKQTSSGFKTLQNFVSGIKIEKVFKYDAFDGFYRDEATLFSSQLRSCDYPFNTKGKYLIFGYIDSDTGFIYSDICFSTAELDFFNSNDLKQLDKLSENFKQELKIKNSEPVIIKSLIEDSPDRIINDLKLQINLLESKNKNLKLIVSILGIAFFSVIILLMIKRKSTQKL